MDTEIEEYVKRFGEKSRNVITDGLTWLRTQEPKWGLTHPVDRYEFIVSLLWGTED